MNALRFSGFDWDDGNIGKCQEHGLSIAEVESIFAGAPLVGPDPFDPEIEQRWRAIGQAASGRTAFVVFTLRGPDGARLIRPISARYMHDKEMRRYDPDQV